MEVFNIALTLIIALLIVLALGSKDLLLHWIGNWYRKLSHSNPYTSIHYHEGIKTIIINNESECIYAINELLAYSPQIVGFDLEWKSKTVKDEIQSKISLMQIAFDNKLIILIRLHLLNNIPSQLISFLNDVTIIKSGVGIYGDKKKLFNDYNINIFGCIELNDIYISVNKQHDSFYGLQRFTKELLKTEMKYKNKINHCEWECKTLTKQQIDYAANDALIGYIIFMEIFNNKCKYSNNNNILQFCFGQIDKNLFSAKSFSKLKNRKNSNKPRKNGKRFEKSGPKAVECICNNKMVMSLVKNCVKNNKCKVQNRSKYLVCHKCYAQQIDENKQIYECKEQKSIFCEKGYFLCINCSLKPKEENYAYKILDKDGDLLHCCSLRMFTLFRAAKDWVERLDRYTIKMKVDVSSININHWDETYFRHIAWITAKKCYVCNSESGSIIPWKCVPKWFKQDILGYRIPICSNCRVKYHKQQILFCHTFCEKYLMKNDAKYEMIYKVKNIKKYIDLIQYEKNRKLLSVEIQNKYIENILKFYYANYTLDWNEPLIDSKELMLKNCEFNGILGIDWWKNKKNYKTIFIRNVLRKICSSYCRKKQDEYMKEILNEYFKEKPLKFAELLRDHLMDNMKPINYNKKYPAFEVLYNEEENVVFDPVEDTFRPKVPKSPKSNFVVLQDDK
eukprot:75322_1